MREIKPQYIGPKKKGKKIKPEKMRIRPHLFTVLTILIALIIIGATVHSYFFFYRHKKPYLKTEKKEYLHYEFVNVILEHPPKTKSDRQFIITIEKNGTSVTTIGGVKNLPLRYNNSLHRYETKWPVPWNAPDGLYSARLILPEIEKKPLELIADFSVIRRTPPKSITPGLGVLTLESTANLRTAKIKDLNGTKGGWENIFLWADFLTADAVWYLAGQTASWGSKIDNAFPWIRSNVDFVPILAKAAHQKGYKFGAWVASYLTFGDQTKKADYTYAHNYDASKGTCVPTRSVSIGDRKRRDDIVKLLTQLAAIPEVDYIGLDYIRNAIGGYEMVDYFTADMHPELPAEWKSYDKMARMCWLGKEIQQRQKMKLVDQWNWWRAQYIANIIKEIKARVNTKKPLWCFTLSWQKGWQHGQDPIMMNDAGADINAVMLYECDRGQYLDLIKDWNRYVGTNQVNLIAGDVVDFNLHQKVTKPASPAELYDRTVMAHKKMTGEGKIKGLFWHDLARALWGRLGPYSLNEWAIAGAATFSTMRQDWGLLEADFILEIPDELSLSDHTVRLKIRNTSSQTLKNIKVKFLPTPYMHCPNAEVTVQEIPPKAEKVIPILIKITGTDAGRARQNMAAFSCEWPSKNPYHKIVRFKYVHVK